MSDHCGQYALSDSKDPAFRGTSTQDHDLICNRYEDLKAVLSDTQKAIQISWHITIAIRKKESELETQAFVHVVEKCIQDSPCVVQLMEHVLSTFKREHPEIKSAFYRQDNAGCYHAANTILACKDISHR